MNIGTRIRQLRLERGFSQENMADELGISTTAYGDIERNKTDVTVSRLQRIAQILNTNWMDLFAESSAVSVQNELLADNEKLRLEVERWQIEAAYWKEKAPKPKDTVVVVLQPDLERRPIGFTAS